MPSYRGINITLHSQFDIMTIQEYTSPLDTHHDIYDTEEEGDDDEPDVFISHDCPRPGHDPSHLHSNTTHHRTASHHSSKPIDVYIPTYPLSQFWIAYEVDFDRLAADVETEETRFFHFKALINGVPAVSWGVGAEQGWKGKTMFAVFGQGKGSRRGQGDGVGRLSGADEEEQGDLKGDHGLEKKGFFFPALDDDEDGSDGSGLRDEEGCLEIRVCRARARRRVHGSVGPLKKVDEENGVR